MTVLADTHAVVWYLTAPDRLSMTAAEAMEDAERNDELLVSAATLELWYLTTKTSSPSLDTEDAVTVLSSVLHPDTNMSVAPITGSIAELFHGVPAAIRDPFDRFLIATAQGLDVPLVSRDRQITECGVVRTIW